MSKYKFIKVNDIDYDTWITGGYDRELSGDWMDVEDYEELCPFDKAEIDGGELVGTNEIATDDFKTVSELYNNKEFNDYVKKYYDHDGTGLKDEDDVVDVLYEILDDLLSNIKNVGLTNPNQKNISVNLDGDWMITIYADRAEDLDSLDKNIFNYDYEVLYDGIEDDSDKYVTQVLVPYKIKIKVNGKALISKLRESVTDMSKELFDLIIANIKLTNYSYDIAGKAFTSFYNDAF